VGMTSPVRREAQAMLETLNRALSAGVSSRAEDGISGDPAVTCLQETAISL